jgi:hypothetical protein
MSFYYNVSNAVIRPINTYADKCIDPQRRPNFVEKQILSRVVNAGSALLTPLTSAVDIIIGLGAGVGTLCTIGTHKPTLQFALKHLNRSNQIISGSYIRALKTLNPNAGLTYATNYDETKNPLIPADGDGLITHYVKKELIKIADGYSSSENILVRNVSNRLTLALLAVSCIVTRVADGIIGLGAATLSFITYGQIESLNNMAYRGLQAPGLINDLFQCIIKIINPWATPA